ncbi:MAG: ThuA domain-containing protein [Verrucomicrobia bacterium]|nr:ThuA domain-containing protein [Verrucomicrobiota bacterium]
MIIPVFQSHGFATLLVIFVSSLLSCNVLAQLESMKRKIVLIAGPLDSHPATTHEYEKSVRLLKHCLDTAPNLPPVNVAVIFNGWPTDPASLDDADTIVFVSAGSDRVESDHPLFAGDRLSEIDRQMQRGCGLAMIHWSTFAPLRVNAKILEWTGGFFDYESGPGDNKWLSAISTRDAWQVTPATPGHPIANGITEPFALKEEFYYKLRFRENDTRLKPIWQVDIDGLSPLERTTAWCVERTDGGRGFGTTGGHFYSNWDVPQFRKTILNAIAWTAKLDIPKEGVESSMLAVEETRDVKPAKSIHALILTGNNHPAHDWAATTKTLTDVLHADPRIGVDVTADPGMLAKADLSYYDVIVQNYSNWDHPGLSDAAKTNFSDYLKNGGGLVILHYANGSWYKTNPSGLAAYWPEYAGKICRRYWDHTVSGHDAFGTFDVTFTDKLHPITEGLRGLKFATNDELYFKQQGELPVEPLAVAKSKVTGADEPMAFAYDYGQGRVFQTVLGHAAESINASGTSQLIMRGTAWAAGATLQSADPAVLDRTKQQSKSAREPTTAAEGRIVAGNKTFRELPLEISCQAKVNSKSGFNILVANEPKASPFHWELYTYAGSGELSLFLPGGGGEFRSGVDVCDGKWHTLAARMDTRRVHLFVDGKKVYSRSHTYPLANAPDGGKLAIGRLVEGGLGCNGEIGEVTLARITVDDTREILGTWSGGDDHSKIGDETPLVVQAANFPFDYSPLDVRANPHSQLAVNANRLYDFYAKEAEHFMRLPEGERPPLLAPFPGLEGGRFGHWGAKGDPEWLDSRWKDMDLGSIMAGVFRGKSGESVKAVAVRLSDSLSVCFDPVTLAFREVWRDGFVIFDASRWGFLTGLKPVGETLHAGSSALTLSPAGQSNQYFGFYRNGERVIFSYRIGETMVLDSPSASKHNSFIRHVAFHRPASGSLSLLDGLKPNDLHVSSDGGKCDVALDKAGNPEIAFKEVTALRISFGKENSTADSTAEPVHLAALTLGGDAQWPEKFDTAGELGTGDGAFVIDTIKLPYKNPYKSLFFCSGNDFFSDGSAAVCTIQGDVWVAHGIDDTLNRVTWNRFAAGLHQPLGLVIVDDVVHVLGKDQITRLHDRNNDGEADYYECFTNAYTTSPGGHDFITGLERDGQGDFWFASTHIGIVRVAADGSSWETVSTGLRNPNGLAANAGGLVTSAPQEGEWTPTSMICEIQQGRHFGYGGPKNGRVDQPLCYLPRGIDHSSGGQVFVNSDRWGPLRDQLIHFSWGNAGHMLVLRDVVEGKEQGAAVPLPGDFLSGAHRGRFNPHDGQLYVTGSNGWSTYAIEDGAFQRVRYTGKPVHLPIEWRAHHNGLCIRFSEPLESTSANNVKNYFCQQWNYHYSKAYGSDEYSAISDAPGHDTVSIRSVHLLDNDSSLFLEIPEIMPVQQMHVRMKLTSADGTDTARDLYATIHHLRPAFSDFPGYQPVTKTLKAHVDPVAQIPTVPLPKHPAAANEAEGREVTIKCAPGLKFDTTEFTVRTGERISLTLRNDDVIPHNLVIVTPGNGDRIGDLAAKLLTAPDALARQYVPDDTEVLWHTLVIDPKASDTIHFTAPAQAGIYPYLCTFPGHWKIMLGEMHVTPHI